MVGSELQDKLSELISVLEETPSQHTVEKAHNLIGEIKQICFRTVSENELAYSCSVLFHRETGILVFLKKVVTVEQYLTVKEWTLEFLEHFLIRADKRAVTYAVDIKDVCVSLFSRDKSAKVKNKTFPVLIKLLELSSGTPVGKKLDVPKLIDKYFSQLMQPTKIPATVKHGIYHILGVFADYYPEFMMGYSDRLVNVYMKALKDQMQSKTKQPEFPVISGCLLGLTHLLTNFTQSVEEESPHAWDIFRFSRMIIYKTDYTRYDVPKAGLWLLARHAPQFNKYLLDDYEEMYEKLFEWCQHHNREMKTAGYAALEAFLKQVSVMLVETVRKDKAHNAAIFKSFVKKFRSIIDDVTSGTREISIAIKGYGLLAAPCKLFLSEDDVMFMFNEMIQRSEQLYFNQSELIDDKIPHLPSFLEALASIVRELDEVSDTFLSSLEKMVVILFENFPRLGKKLHYICFKCITAVFGALSPKGATLRTFISRVVYQGLIRTCSQPVVLEGEVYDIAGVEVDETNEDVLSDSRRVSYRDYLDLWSHLLDSSRLKEADIGLPPQERKVLHGIIYDELISGILRILKKLDLTSNKTTQDDQLSTEPGPSNIEATPSSANPSSDPVAGLQPVKPKDFQIFVNLVDFSRDFLPDHCPYYFERWAYTFGHEVIVLSTQLPLVSGFYKLLSVCMKICQKIGYFKAIDVKSTSPTTTDKEAAFHLFKKFVKEVLVRLKQFKDDLLASCLFLVLALPHEIIASDVVAVVPALQTTFKIGLSYLPLAHAGLDALESWALNLPQTSLQPHYKDILPCLDGYLKTASDKNNNSASAQTVSLTKTSTGRGRKKIPIKLLKAAETSGQSEDSPLAAVKLKIVQLLGSLGGSINACLLESSKDEVAKKAVAWDTEERLQFPVPFMDIKPVICFDPFLPRVVELATTSSDRQTKVAACELLHSLVLYMIGRGAQQPDTKQAKAPMEKLYKKVLPVLLQLACDVEQVSRQLFEPLVMQMIHWFTNNKKFESPETIAMLDAILDGICHPTDTALRDFSAKCTKEFLKWSIKQTSKKQQDKSPINTKSLMKRLYSMALHPNAFKRVGAALAFNNIYTVFREEESLVDQFALEVLVTYINSLAMAHSDDKSLGTQEQCVQVINHLERIVRVKSNLLNKDSKSKNRRVPRDFNRDECPTLSHVVMWLLKQCGRPQTECRHQCMVLICKLVPLLPGNNSPSVWMQKTLREKHADYYISRFESGGGKAGHRTGIVKHPTLDSMEQTFSVKVALNWFDLLLAALDCYTWVIGEKLLSPADMFSATMKKQSNLFKSLDFFMTKLSLEDIFSAAKCFKSTMTGAVFTPREVEDYNKAKCTVIVRLIDFLTVLLAFHSNELGKSIPISVWSSSLLECIINCVIDPSAVGFDMADVEVINNLPVRTGQLLTLLAQKAPSGLVSDVKKCIQKILSQKRNDDILTITPSLLKGGDKNVDFVKLIHMVSGYEQLQKANLLLPALQQKGGITGEKLSHKLLTVVFESIATKKGHSLIVSHLSPTSHELATRLLDLAFLLHNQSKELLKELLNKTAVKSGTSESSAGYYGLTFYSQFKNAVNTQLALHVQEVVPALLKQAATESTIISTLLNGLLDHIANNRELRKKQGMEVHSAILSNWNSLKCWWSADATHDQRSSVLILLKKLLQIDSKFIVLQHNVAFQPVFNMYLSMLSDSNTSLAFKSRALDVLYFFAKLPQPELGQLQGCMNTLVAANFPLKSNEFTIGSQKYNDYVGAFGKILSALVLSGSMMLLELLISIMCRENRHVCEEQIQTSLVTFVKHLAVDNQRAAVDVAYSVFIKEKEFPNDIRRAALERVCLPLMRMVETSALSKFFISHVIEIMGIIEAKQTKVPESAFETQLVSKIGCFQLMELLYSRLTKEELNSPASQINKIYCQDSVKTGKEMTTNLTRVAHASKGEDIRGETVLVDLRRQFHCAAYNTLIAVICCTQTEVKFYNGFLFSENTAKGQFFLDNLLDADKEYRFEIELESAMERKKKFVAIRKEVRQANRDSDFDDSAYTAYSNTSGIRYLSSQYLADSSLSEEISQFDLNSGAFSSTIDRDKDRTSAGSQMTLGRPESPVEPSAIVKGDYLEMEMDELNKHECMATMTAVLKHMDRNKVTPEVAKGTKPTEMPGWMSYLNKKLINSSTHSNVKLFIVKLIINTAEVFRPYARFWFTPLMEWLISGDTCGDGIHYMIRDTMVVMLMWATTATPEESERILVSRVVEFLMKNTHHSNRQVLRNNLELVKTVVELWKDSIEVPSRVIFNHFSCKDPSSKENATGVQLLAVILANKLPPYRESCGIDKNRFYVTLSANLSFKYKDVYAATGEVVGMVMKYMAEKEKVTEGTFHDAVQKELTVLHSSRPEVFITNVYKIQLHHAPFADRFINKLLFMLPKLHGQPKSNALEVILSRADHIDNLFIEMKNKSITEMLRHRDEAIQHVSLKIVNEMLKKLKETELLFLMPPVVAISNNQSAVCRETMYDILMWIYDNYREEESATANEILSMTKECLLQGLSDEESYLRLRVSNFWSHETRLPSGTLDRMVSMLECMYSNSTENQFLSYSTSLLLEMTSKSPDYKREVFEHPLSECKFEDYQIDHSWQRRHAAISTPMFVETQSSQSSPVMSTQGTAETISNQIRATQDAQQFTATQDVDAAGRRKSAYNWLTGSQDTFAEFSATAGTETQSSLLFTIGTTKKKPLTRKPGRAVGPGFGNEKMGEAKDQVDGAEESSQVDKDILRLKRRFLKDQEAQRSFFAKREARLKKMREEIQKEQKQRRHNTVTLYRSYRHGDLPDIQIKYMYLIAPLQALAQRDAGIARQLFTSLFCGIFKQIEEVKTEKETQDTIEDINKHVNMMLSNSSQYYPPFIGCIQDIAYRNCQHIPLDAESVSTAALISQQQPLGVLLLEEYLVKKSGDEERSRKKARGAASPVSKEISTWIELSRLYKNLDNFDVLCGIFSGKIETQKITRQALEAEASGDYQKAAKLYDQALDTEEWDDERPEQIEEDLWDDCRLQCYAQLTNWEKLEECSTVNLDDSDPPDLQKIWTDTYYQEHYLPYVIRSKLRLLIEGAEDQSLLTFIDKSMQNRERKALLETRYCEELAMLYLIQDDNDRAKYYTANCIQAFLEDWSGTDALMMSTRSSKLQCVQKLSEMQEFLTFISKERNFDDQGALVELIRKWSKRLPDVKKDSINTWDDVVTNRCFYLETLLHKADVTSRDSESMEVDGEESLLDRVGKEKIRMQLKLADSACQQNNFGVSEKYLKMTNGEIGGDDLMRLLWIHGYTRLHHKKSQSLPLAKQISNILTTVDQLEKYTDNDVLNADSSLDRQHAVLTGQSCYIIAESLQKSGDDIFDTLSENKLRSLMSLSDSMEEPDRNEIIDGLLKKAFGFYKKAVKSASDEEEIHRYDNSQMDKRGITKAYVAIATFCDNVLRQQEEEEDGAASEAVTSSFPKSVVIHLLKALKLNSVEATQRFPRLLQMVETYPETMDTFVNMTSEIPSWMFLGWLGQMLALLDKNESPAVHRIILDIAEQYPQALVYPFKMSSENFSFEKSNCGKKNKEVADKLSGILDNVPMVNVFISALEQLTNPEHVFKDWANDVIVPLLRAPKKDTNRIRAAAKEVCCKLVDYKSQSVDTLFSQDSDVGTQALPFGAYRRRFAQEFFQKSFEEVFGEGGNRIASMDLKTFRDQYNKLFAKVDAKKKEAPGNLKEYSPWLSEFQPINYDRELEIPGQYRGRSKPLPEYHVKIAGFDEKVLVLTSLRRPKRLTIRGNDEKEYRFLVKGGEDLRLDQRIEQLYGIMNDILAQDPSCSRRSLKLVTYEVIPMTPRIGMIEWVDNCQPLKQFIDTARTDQERKMSLAARDKHNEFVSKFAGAKKNNGHSVRYGELYRKANRTEVIKAFQEFQSLVPWDLLRRAFLKLSTSPEAFLMLRSHFATTHAVICICQYILGIGDRHLSNFMVCLDNGGMVGIDFGHAFGSATEILPVPELMPFRLTRQILNLMMPLKEEGLLISTMIHCLRALRNSPDLLLNTMDVFVKEPHLDWERKAKEEVSKYQEDAETLMAVYAKHRIGLAKRKLLGANPSYITREELRRNGSIKKNNNNFSKQAIDVCMGEHRSVRAKNPESGLSVENQVACLVEQATDQNILGRTYLGWEPWV
ncbi:DNA-dependent protein kinase catalytic subunit-like [Ptychodera flava]|uniref:DNA-dependent protein kinase catalytic subunit-like n=1 Tax=Ptychodera flava TaxID=63121 RepID=UPI003969FA0B